MRATTLALSTLFVASYISGCGDANPPVDSEVVFHHITQADIDQLPAGEVLFLDITQDDHVYIFDYSEMPLDFSRIEVLCPNGQTMLMTQWLDLRLEESGVDLRNNKAKRFAFASDPHDFGSIERWEIDKIERDGSYMQDIDGSAIFGSRTSAIEAGGWREYRPCPDGGTICHEVECPD